MMRSRLFMLIGALLLCGSFSVVNAEENTERMQSLETLMELAVDRFELNRFVEARAALNRLISKDPSNEEAFKLRKLFGEKIMLEMQKYGVRPVLKPAERQILSLLTEASFALELRETQKASDRVQKVIEILSRNDYTATSFEMQKAQLIKSDLASAGDDTVAIDKVNKLINSWRDQLQSVGNVPLLLISRAQRHEQAMLRNPEAINKIVGGAVNSTENVQRYLLEVSRLGAYAVPALVKNLRDDKNDLRRTNAHFILLALGDQVVQPLCATLQSTDQLLVQQVCNILGEIKPAQRRAVPYLKAVYDNTQNLESTRNAAALALEDITGKKIADLLPAQDYFLIEANRYYLGGVQVDEELVASGNTFWVWDQAANGNVGALQQIEVPSFALSDMIAEDQVFRGMELASEKTAYQVLLASIFIQQKEKTDTINKLYKRTDMSYPNALQNRKAALDWGKRQARNMRIAYALGADYLSAVLEKAMADQKVEVAVGALKGITLVSGKDGWAKLEGYKAVNPFPNMTPTQYYEVKDELAPSMQMTEGVGSSGDAGVPVEAVVTETPVAHSASTSAASSAANPLIKALDSKHDRIAIAAANCLVRIGFTTNNPAYAKLLPILMKGAEENRATIAEVISADMSLRDRMTHDLEKAQIIPLTSTDGFAGYTLATQYPPKDAIIIDNRIDMFKSLKLQLELRKVSHGQVLPLTIITSSDHARRIAEQFAKKAIDAEAAKNNTTADDIVDNENSQFEQGDYRVIIRHKIQPDAEGVFEDLQGIVRASSGVQTVVLLTNPTYEGRKQIKDTLLLRAERSLRPTGLTEYARLRNKDKVLGDIFGVRATYVPVFTDSELAGFDSMQTVLALQSDPRTRAVPIAIVADKIRVPHVEKDFELFIKDGVVRVIPTSIDADDLVKAVKEMKSKNKLSQLHFARALSNDIAASSAEAIAMLDVNNSGRMLSDEEQKVLAMVAADSTRPQSLRIAAVEALGHFKAAKVVKVLMTLFVDAPAEETALRAALVRAIGMIDTNNEYMDFKIQAMNDVDPQIQQEAARALGPAAQNGQQLQKYLQDLRPNDPLRLSRNAGAVEEKVEVEVEATAEPEEEQAEEASSGEEEEEFSLDTVKEQEDRADVKDDDDALGW